MRSYRTVGRPADPRELREQIGVRFPAKVDDYLREKAEERNVPIAEVVRELVQRGLEES